MGQQGMHDNRIEGEPGQGNIIENNGLSPAKAKLRSGTSSRVLLQTFRTVPHSLRPIGHPGNVGSFT